MANDKFLSKTLHPIPTGFFPFNIKFGQLVKTCLDFGLHHPNFELIMPTAVTDEIMVSVKTEYQPDFSNPGRGEHFFSYHIHIENLGDYTVQLLRRHWYIHDSNGEKREVEGEGVVGFQPVIETGNDYFYSSGCNLKSDLGKMYGTYEFIRVADGKTFEVEIPVFRLCVPYRLN